MDDGKRIKSVRFECKTCKKAVDYKAVFKSSDISKELFEFLSDGAREDQKDLVSETSVQIFRKGRVRHVQAPSIDGPSRA